jgi:nucleotide-binding universal stress UspA family protein
MYSKILVPLDGSKTAEAVLPYARYLAGKLKIPVHLLAVIDVAEMALHSSSEKKWFIDRMVDDGRRLGETYLHQLAATFPGIAVRYTVEVGHAADAIIEKGASDAAMLIAMATHGRSGLDRYLLGSVAEKVLRGTDNPLLLVRSGAEVPAAGVGFTNIVVPLDGSELAESILPMVSGLAKKFDSEVMLFRAYHIPMGIYEGDALTSSEAHAGMLDRLREEAATYLDSKSAEMRKLEVKKVSTLVDEGFAADEIIDLGSKKPAALIAMASHGRSGVKRWLLGSVTETVVRHAAGAILVARGL